MGAAPRTEPVLGGLFAATIAVADLESVIAAYTEYLGYTLRESGAVSAALADSWGAPAAAGSAQAILAPASEADVYLRMVETPAHADYRPLRTYGWASVELAVADVDDLARRLARSPFQILGEPHDLDFSDAIRAMQVKGPADEILLLTQFVRETPEFDVPPATVPVDQMFVAILASPDLDEANRFYAERLDAVGRQDYQTAIWILNDAFGFDRSTRHRLTTFQLPKALIEIDQYPEGAVARNVVTGHLPPGVALVAFRTSNLDQLDLPWLAPPAVRPEAPYSGRRSATLLGAVGERIELVEDRRTD